MASYYLDSLLKVRKCSRKLEKTLNKTDRLRSNRAKNPTKAQNIEHIPNNWCYGLPHSKSKETLELASNHYREDITETLQSTSLSKISKNARLARSLRDNAQMCLDSVNEKIQELSEKIREQSLNNEHSEASNQAVDYSEKLSKLRKAGNLYSKAWLEWSELYLKLLELEESHPEKDRRNIVTISLEKGEIIYRDGTKLKFSQKVN